MMKKDLSKIQISSKAELLQEKLFLHLSFLLSLFMVGTLPD
jgi:hypothetical protein